MPIEPGQVFGGKYRIVRLLGEGGMGAVYEGENARIHRKVAIKVLHPTVASNADVVKRFEREAQAAGRIGSKHIVEVLDLGELDDGTRYMVLEFLDGLTLADRIHQHGRLSPEQATPILHQLLEGLGAAHQAGIIHRDLKPANVFLLQRPGQPEFVKILDFGVSKFNVLSSGDDAFSMTKTGAVMGTPFYMSPEQAKGARSIDARSDLYTVGVILYECLTGQVPYHAETFNELMFKIVLEAPRPPETFVPDLDPGISAIVRKAMAREPADRYQTAAELQQALAERPVAPDGPVVPASPLAESAAAVRAMPTPSRGLPAVDPVVLPKQGNGLLVAAVIAAGVVIGGGAFAAMRWKQAGSEASTSGSAGPAASIASAAPEVAAASASAAAEAASATPTPVEPPIATASATADPAGAPTARGIAGKAGGTAQPRASSTPSTTATPSAAAPAAPATGPTGRKVSGEL